MKDLPKNVASFIWWGLATMLIASVISFCWTLLTTQAVGPTVECHEADGAPCK